MCSLDAGHTVEKIAPNGEALLASPPYVHCLKGNWPLERTDGCGLAGLRMFSGREVAMLKYRIDKYWNALQLPDGL